VAVEAGKKGTVDVPVRMWDLRNWDEAAKRYVVEAGTYELEIGSSSDDVRQRIEVRVH
jgi:hypothetical protein